MKDNAFARNLAFLFIKTKLSDVKSELTPRSRLFQLQEIKAEHPSVLPICEE